MISYQILKWDSEFFGFKAARIINDNLSAIQISTIIDELRQEKVRLVYWSTSVNFDPTEILKKYKGQLVDLKTTYFKSLKNYSEDNLIAGNNIFSFSASKPNNDLYNLAVQSGEYSRFNVDPNIPSGIYQKLYKIWMEKSVSKELADDVVVYKINGVIAGMITLYIKNYVGFIGLIGVDKKYRGTGIGSNLIRYSFEYFKNAGCYMTEVVTQGENKAACALYEKNGFLIKEQVRYYHFWI